jgi:hypothetical protein
LTLTNTIPFSATVAIEAHGLIAQGVNRDSNIYHARGMLEWGPGSADSLHGQ